MPLPRDASASVETWSTGNADGSKVPHTSTATAACHSFAAVGGTAGLVAATAGCNSSYRLYAMRDTPSRQITSRTRYQATGVCDL